MALAEHNEQSTLQALPSVPGRSERLMLTAIGPFGVRSVSLPESGAFTIGRAVENDLCLDDPEVSRRQATLHLGDEIEIEDHGGPNGTTVGGTLIKNTRVTFSPGQLIEMTSTMLVVQRVRRSSGPRRVWPHDYFELRLAEECARASAVFSVVVVLSEYEEDASAVERAIDRLASRDDVVARYAAGQYELFLPGAGRSRAEGLGRSITEGIEEREGPVRFGASTFPADGRSNDMLISTARARARGTVPATDDAPVIADPAMIDLYRVAARVGGGRISVLLLGETGAGKEILAEHIHQSSPRRGQPYLRLNCGALTESLLESELFGHEKGAFTGADRAKPGLLETADRGTIFLDEVGELPPAIQVKLLRVIEQREVLRVGGLKPKSVDVRFISATNRDLEQEIGMGRFRQDLFFRLAGATLTIPPLRERKQEIELLARRFLAEAAHANGDEEIPRLSPRALEMLLSYDWPGNIRELRNMMERAVLLCLAETIEPEHLPLEKMRSLRLDGSVPEAPVQREPGRDWSERELADRDRAVKALDACAGNQTRAAKYLGVSRRTLVKKIIKYDLPRPRK